MTDLGFPDLIKTVSKSLRESGGASNEYQHTVVELKSLEHIIQHLAALQPSEGNIQYVNAVRGMALACQIPLQDFMSKLAKYETSLGPFANHTATRGTRHKVKWALFFREEVDKLRALVTAKHISITLLLASQSS